MCKLLLTSGIPVEKLSKTFISKGFSLWIKCGYVWISPILLTLKCVDNKLFPISTGIIVVVGYINKVLLKVYYKSYEH